MSTSIAEEAAVRSAQPTTHACLRYAQRVLGLTLEGPELQKNQALKGRCARGITRLMGRAWRASGGEDGEIWVAGTRALVVKDDYVLTVMVAPTSKGFSKRFLRRGGASLRSSLPAASRMA